MQGRRSAIEAGPRTAVPHRQGRGTPAAAPPPFEATGVDPRFYRWMGPRDPSHDCVRQAGSGAVRPAAPVRRSAPHGVPARRPTPRGGNPCSLILHSGGLAKTRLLAKKRRGDGAVPRRRDRAPAPRRTPPRRPPGIRTDARTGRGRTRRRNHCRRQGRSGDPAQAPTSRSICAFRLGSMPSAEARLARYCCSTAVSARIAIADAV